MRLSFIIGSDPIYSVLFKVVPEEAIVVVMIPARWLVIVTVNVIGIIKLVTGIVRRIEVLVVPGRWQRLWINH